MQGTCTFLMATTTHQPPCVVHGEKKSWWLPGGRFRQEQHHDLQPVCAQGKGCYHDVCQSSTCPYRLETKWCKACLDCPGCRTKVSSISIDCLVSHLSLRGDRSSPRRNMPESRSREPLVWIDCEVHCPPHPLPAPSLSTSR